MPRPTKGLNAAEAPDEGVGHGLHDRLVALGGDPLEQCFPLLGNHLGEDLATDDKHITGFLDLDPGLRRETKKGDPILEGLDEIEPGLRRLVFEGELVHR